MIKSIKKYILNKYSIVTLVFIIYLLMFANNDLITQFRNVVRLHRLQEKTELLKAKIQTNKKQLYDLTSNKDALEKFARENYRMKKENEDIYVVVRE